MIDFLASPAALTVLFALFVIGGVGSLIGRSRDALANVWGHMFAIVGSVWGLMFATAVLASGKEVAATLDTSLWLFQITLHVDKLAAFFMLIICLIGLFCSIYGLGYVREYYRHFSIGALNFFYAMFILGMLLVVTAANGLWFLFAWEIMSLASYFLVVYDRRDAKNVRAGFVYLVMTHVGAMCITLAFTLLYVYTNSFDFAVITAQIHQIPAAAMAAVLVLTLVGLGTKAGIIPLHIWLPLAHPAAPSYVSAMMSGVMIKTGIYMMVRLYFDVLQPAPMWWGQVILALGAVSALVGVLYALTEHDIKRLLAYHSIENIGIILLGVGSALIFQALNQPVLVSVALAAALFHTLNHATFKSLLFLSAGSVIQATHTRNIEHFGGLLKYLPLTGIFFLVGSMAISALPPFNGFFSEWMTFQALFSGLSGVDANGQWWFLFAAGALAVTGGLALACFVKAFGVTFLARPRSAAVRKAKEAPRVMVVGMAGLATLCIVLGLASAPIIALISSVATELVPAGLNAVSNVTNQTMPAGLGLAAVPGPIIALLLAFAGITTWLGVRYGINRRQRIVVGDTWDCGTPLNSRMQITATGFSQSIIRVFGGVLRPTVTTEAMPQDASHPYGVATRRVNMHVRDLYQTYIYAPLFSSLRRISSVVKYLQNGNLNSYVLYIFLVVIITLILGAK